MSLPPDEPPCQRKAVRIRSANGEAAPRAPISSYAYQCRFSPFLMSHTDQSLATTPPHSTRPARLSPIVTDCRKCATAHRLPVRSARLPWHHGATLRIVAGVTKRPLPVIGERKEWGRHSGHRREAWIAIPMGHNQTVLLWLWRRRQSNSHLALFFR
jgi:hypothetical protein